MPLFRVQCVSSPNDPTDNMAWWSVLADGPLEAAQRALRLMPDAEARVLLALPTFYAWVAYPEDPTRPESGVPAVASLVELANKKPI